ncbi:DUF6454 family protein [Kribbella shirazensis]|uniref:Sugar lactone lactonase YvrE n=1 Tax=Kribbella shirazensis TaxID=1105143 RepID=A0A7X5V8U1_9ACTN|nr:DUF6454 family protein [Kribbella shirazensis]NIK56682.1 hypothetical protein [Kribbella shirazensis]
MRRRLLAIALAGVLLTGLTTAQATGRDSDVTRAFQTTNRSTAWSLVERVPLKFPTYHPQGFALVGDLIFLSSVEVLEAPVKYPAPVGGYDRTPGKGIGHVFVLDRRGNLKKDIRLGEGTAYHPGGVDFDGRDVWVPVAEYRPNSRAVVYTVDPKTYRVTERFRVQDHVGGVVRDRTTGQVHGVSWGSRTLYNWTSAGKQLGKAPNESHLLDYQDCDYVSRGKQLCGGVTGLAGPDNTSYNLGGLALLDLRTNRILHEIPFPHFSPTTNHNATRNPVALETTKDKLRLYTAPDDGEDNGGTELQIYEAPLK